MGRTTFTHDFLHAFSKTAKAGDRPYKLSRKSHFFMPVSTVVFIVRPVSVSLSLEMSKLHMTKNLRRRQMDPKRGEGSEEKKKRKGIDTRERREKG